MTTYANVNTLFRIYQKPGAGIAKVVGLGRLRSKVHVSSSKSKSSIVGFHSRFVPLLCNQRANALLVYLTLSSNPHRVLTRGISGGKGTGDGDPFGTLEEYPPDLAKLLDEIDTLKLQVNIDRVLKRAPDQKILLKIHSRIQLLGKWSFTICESVQPLLGILDLLYKKRDELTMSTVSNKIRLFKSKGYTLTRSDFDALYLDSDINATRKDKEKLFDILLHLITIVND
jgi:hypothetical protein